MKIFSIMLLIVFPFASVAQQVKVSTGSIKNFASFPSKFVDPRNVDVWLPDNYSTKKKYAVLYMHDGQMLFDSTTTWNKQEWRVDETIGKLIASKKIRECIVVAIWNNFKKRNAEYFPQKAVSNLPVSIQDELIQVRDQGFLGDNYLKFMVTELKPFI
ncbi:MAG: hypothetical protein LH473_09955, partial [Chitinophagales bacterium]|nr:hypothetical protein [Chitinophagales bacterium]